MVNKAILVGLSRSGGEALPSPFRLSFRMGARAARPSVKRSGSVGPSRSLVLGFRVLRARVWGGGFRTFVFGGFRRFWKTGPLSPFKLVTAIYQV